MTDNEWIKIYNAKDGTWDKDLLIDEANNIINRQKARIEELKPTEDRLLHIIEALLDKDDEDNFIVDAVKDFAERLCADRVSNDPVVIAVKTQLKMMEVEKMGIDKAIRLIKSEYEKAKKLEFVHNPVAYALYQVWKKADTDHSTKKDELTENVADNDFDEIAKAGGKFE